MSDINQNLFPKERYDQMVKAAREFSKDSLPTDLLWRFDANSNMDAAESAFIARQLEFIRPAIYEVRYPDLKAAQLIPFNTSIDPGAAQYTVRIMDQVGQVKVSKDQTDDVPMVEVKVTQASMGFFSMSLGYAYSDQEAREAIFTRMPLLQQKAMAVRSQMARKLDDMAFVGDTTAGITGLLNQSGPLTYSTPTTGEQSSALWNNKASDDVLLDLNAPVQQVVSESLGIEKPNQWLLPLTAYGYINGRRVGDGTSMSILKYFLENNAYGMSVEYTEKSETTGSGTTGRAVAYRNDAECLEMIVPLAFEQKAPQVRGFHVVTLCHMRAGGVAMYRPKSVIYMDSISVKA